ncbi:MAG: hypothetical protein KDB61_09555, partial [Planctomycetes bacterium]|nr:hypothetical protein [Planctomycetota bacterium]
MVVNGQIIAPTPVNGPASMIPYPGAGTWFNLSIHVPATGQEELFILGLPNSGPSVNAPLLVGFRASNVSHQDVLVHTTFWDECLARGWYFLAPLSHGIATQVTTSGSCLNAQLNTEAALKWVTAHYPIDMDRIYGVGFSAGAETLGSYASRHLDPADPMFAAIAFHTGPVDNVDVYNQSSVSGKSTLATIFGGTPSTVPFEYRRVGLLELDAMQLWVSGGAHAARNLGSIPTQIWYATNDQNLQLVQHTTQLFDWMNLNGLGIVSVHSAVNPDPTGGFHNWTVLDEVQICDWFELQTRSSP